MGDYVGGRCNNNKRIYVLGASPVSDRGDHLTDKGTAVSSNCVSRFLLDIGQLISSP